MLATVIFIFSYILIASRRLSLLPIGRPSGALLGALLMVACGILTPEESYQAIDHNTILLLLAMMVVTAYLESSHCFNKLLDLISRLVKTPRQLIWAIALTAGLLSAFLVNDTICLVMTPLVLLLCRRYRLPFLPYLMCLATSANIGSAATLVGNPQNMIIGNISQLPFGQFALIAGPTAIGCLIINIVLLQLFYKELPSAFSTATEYAATPEMTQEIDPNLSPRLRWLPAIVTVLVAIGFFCGLHMGYTALAGAMLLILFGHREPTAIFRRIDWTLLLFFAGLFIVIRGFATTGYVDQAWSYFLPYIKLNSASGVAIFTIFVLIASNLFSNVPLVLLLAPAIGTLDNPLRGFLLLAFVSTVAGNLTLLGSVANIIVAEQSRNDYQLDFWRYLRYGFPSTLAITAIGTVFIVLLT